MTSKHTPGPWKHRHTPLRGIANDVYCVDWSEDQEEVAEVVHGEANARLIAAAPDLLEALQVLDALWCENESGGLDFSLAIDRARAAIAKATGDAD